MARVIEAVQIFKKVEDVTSAKDDPPPVYLMDELADMARGSFESAEKIAGRIGKRLEHKSPVVKFKALRLTRHIANKGCGNFQRAMQKHASAVRSLIHFKGEHDPFKGDTPNQRVRDAAKEAAEALSNTVMAQPVSSLGSRIQGFGSSAAPAPSLNNGSQHNSGGNGAGGGGGGGAGSSSTGRMMGFGSSNSAAPTASGSGAGPGNGFGFGSAQRGVNRPLTGGYGGEAGGASAGSGSAGGYGGGYSAPAVAATDVLGSEDQLVESICTPSGLRLAPDPDDLRRFVEAVGSLDGLRVAELLRDKMDGSGSWQQMLRALYALEAVLLQGATQACGEIAVMFQSDPGPVQAATASPQAAVRERAGHVLKLLLGDAVPSTAQPAAPAATARTGPAASASAQPAAPAAMDLLGGLDMLGSPMQPPPGLQQQLQRPDDIFSNLVVPTESAATPQASASFQPQPATGGYQLPASRSSQAQQQQAYAARTSVDHQVHGMDPFGINALQSSAAPSMPFMVPHAQQWQPPPQLPQAQQQQQPYGTGLPSGSSGMGQVNSVATGSLRPHAAQAPPPRNLAAPLDDLFSDMSLSGSTATPGGTGPGPSAAYGGVGSVGPRTAYGASSNTYGSALGGSGTSGVALPSAYSSASGNFNPPAGGSRPGSQLDLLGMGGAAAHGAPYGALYGGSGLGGLNGAHGGAAGAGLGGMAVPQAQLHKQIPAKAPAREAGLGPLGGDLLGAVDSGLRAGPSATGSSTAFASGAGTGNGMNLMGIAGSSSSMGIGIDYGGRDAGSAGVASGLGTGAAPGGGMIVGPGGQVRYVGKPGHTASTVAYGAPSGMSTGTGVWQPAPAAPQMHSGAQVLQPVAGAGPGVQQRSPAAFDFVLDQFK